MNRSAMLVAVGLVSFSCGNPTGPRIGVARQAITVAPNAVSCSTPAKAAFDHALCVCENLQLTGSGLSVMSSDSWTTDVGVNGSTQITGDYDVAGSLVSWRRVDNTGDLTVRDDLATTGSVSGTGTLHVGRDLIAGGAVDTVGTFTVGGQLRVAGAVQNTGTTGPMTLGAYAAPALPCGCGAQQLLDVGKLVDEAKTKNDNAPSGVAPNLSSTGTLTLALNGGRIYLGDLSSVGSLDLVVHQPTALFIDGDWETVGRDTITVDENASLDLYVKGQLENVGTWKVGQGTLAGVVRVYVGGDRPLVESVGEADFVGALYAPTAEVQLTGSSTFRGALFVKSLTGTGKLLVDYAKPALPAEGACP